MHFAFSRFFLLILILVVQGGCASRLDPSNRRTLVEELLTAADWQELRLETSPISLVAFVPRMPPVSNTLTVYIEGDGLAWISRDQPSRDPTPIDPLALRLALAQPKGAAAYLARPCQYLTSNSLANCAPKWWRAERFSEAVVVATLQALDRLKERSDSKHLVLVGYSGGGALAALAAARRSDVIKIVTVAGNLDHAAWSRFHDVSPLSGSLNPADETLLLANMEQIHLAGGMDKVVPPKLVEGYVARYRNKRRPHLNIFPGFDHSCCWVKDWPLLWSNEFGLIDSQGKN